MKIEPTIPANSQAIIERASFKKFTFAFLFKAITKYINFLIYKTYCVGKKMRIAVFTDTFWPQINGVVTSIVNSCNALAEKGHEIIIFAPEPKEKKAGLKLNKKIKVQWIAAINLPTYKEYRISPPVSIKAEETTRKFNPDIIHVHTPFSLGWIGVSLAKIMRKPLIGTYHTLLPEFLVYLPLPLIKKTDIAKKISWAYTRLFYKNCNVITTPSEAMKKELEAHGLKNVFELSNAIDFELFNEFRKKKFDSKKIKLVYFGRISYEKNIEVIIKAVKILKQEKFPVEFRVIGEGPAIESLKEEAKKEGLEKEVQFLGAFRGKELARKVIESDIFVTASTIETQGLTVLEAMAAGLPCIGADFLAIPEAIKNGKNGFLFKAFNEKQLAEKIIKLHSSQKLMLKFSENAVNTAQEKSTKNIERELEKLYEKTKKLK